MRNLRACWRLLRVLGHILKGLAIVAVRFPALPPDQQYARVQAWSLELLAHAGVSLRIIGTPPVTGPVMLVANHLSWLDIPVMHAARHCRFVSKSDVQAWPLIGTLATAAGTLYIERNSRRDALRMVRSMHEALQRGEVLAVFPEGTTGDGRAMLPFHANLLQAAVTAKGLLGHAVVHHRLDRGRAQGAPDGAQQGLVTDVAGRKAGHATGLVDKAQAHRLHKSVGRHRCLQQVGVERQHGAAVARGAFRKHRQHLAALQCLVHGAHHAQRIAA